MKYTRITSCRGFSLVLLVLTFFSLAEASDPKTPAELASILQARYEKTDVIQANFSQETLPPGAKEGISADGRVIFKRPHAMRWEYERPEPQLIVTSGEDVFVYEKEANQVLVIPQDQFLNSEVSRAFFLGKGDLERFFRIESPDESGDKSVAGSGWSIKLVPRDENPQVRTIHITMDPETHLVREMCLEDHMGGRTRLFFRDIALNVKVDSAIFSFTPPSGVEIFRTTK